jgi:site-specific recombinase XerD
VTPAELVERYFTERSPAWAESTRDCQRRALQRFLRFLAGRSLSRENVLAYVCHLNACLTPRGTPWAPRSVEGALLSVRTFLKWAQSHVLEDLASWIKVPRTSPLPRALSEEDVTRLIEQGPPAGEHHARDRAILELLYGTGLRASELCRLDLVDVALSEGLLLVRQGKGRKDRVVPFGERARTSLLSYLREERRPLGGPVFLSRRGGRLTRAGLGSLLLRAKRRAGLTVPASAHCLRHSYATHLLRHGAGVVSVQALLGHARLHSTQVYLDLDVEDLKRMIERSHPRERVRPHGRIISSVSACRGRLAS